MGMEGDGAVKQCHQGLKTGLVVHAAGFKCLAHGQCQSGQPLDVAANAQQPPAVVSHHAVSLGTGDASQCFTGFFQCIQCFLRGRFGVRAQLTALG